MIGLSFLRMRACYLYFDDIANHIFKYIFLTSLSLDIFLSCLLPSSDMRACVVYACAADRWLTSSCLCCSASALLSVLNWNRFQALFVESFLVPGFPTKLTSACAVHCRPSTEMLYLVLPWNLVRVSSFPVSAQRWKTSSQRSRLRSKTFWRSWTFSTRSIKGGISMRLVLFAELFTGGRENEENIKVPNNQIM